MIPSLNEYLIRGAFMLSSNVQNYGMFYAAKLPPTEQDEEEQIDDNIQMGRQKEDDEKHDIRYVF